ncbi:MAG TPA: DUF3410 domain-containing protein, partial [Spirochaetota bacterium]|nr:DUF3410 domain-containing protein [Spirochaetota bacterium]
FVPADKILGIVGVGHVGSKAAAAARILGMKVLYNDPPRAEAEGQAGFTDLDDLLRKADIITLHVPLADTGRWPTAHMINKDVLAGMRPEQILINTSRGPVVDNQALQKTLLEHKLKAAVLDVWENEPQLDTKLLRLVTIGTPHIAGYSRDGKANGTRAAVRACSDFFHMHQVPLAHIKPQAPAEPDLTLEGRPGNEQHDFHKAVKHSYDIGYDYKTLLQRPAAFDRLRADYYNRREFPAYTVNLKNDNKLLRKWLKKANFNLRGEKNG